MECLIQYLDDLEDLFYAVALLAEKIRRVIQLILITGLYALIPVSGVLLALAAPPLALASVCMALTLMLYRAATGQSARHAAG